jgi:hypothetical protein
VTHLLEEFNVKRQQTELRNKIELGHREKNTKKEGCLLSMPNCKMLRQSWGKTKSQVSKVQFIMRNCADWPKMTLITTSFLTTLLWKLARRCTRS